MIEEISLSAGAKLYRLTETDPDGMEISHIYQRFKGSFSWPTNVLSPFVCIVGEKYDTEKELRPLRVCYQDRQSNLDTMVKTCATLQDLYHLNGWICECGDDKESYMAFFRDFRRMKKREDLKSQVSFSFFEPRLSSDFKLAQERIYQRYTKALLTIPPKDGILATRIAEANQEDPNQPKLAEKYPEIMVLAWIITAFDQSSFDPEKPPYRPQRPPSPMAA